MLVRISIAITTAAAGAAQAGPTIRVGSGANPAEIQAVVGQFRADVSLGGGNNTTNGPFATGRREINWDAAVADPVQSPNLMPFNFFNSNLRRGAEFTTPDGKGFLLSRRNAADPNDPNRLFGDIDPSYAGTFSTFSPLRIFAVQGGVITDVHFFVPGEPARPATVNGFGAVFSDVDRAGATFMEFYDLAGKLVRKLHVPAGRGADKSLSFAGATFDDDRIALVRIVTGTHALAPGRRDGRSVDLVVMDDFIYGEPQPCYPDCNNSGHLTVADFTCFQTRFVVADGYADCDGSGTLTIADFGCFQTRFVRGCR